MQVLHDRYQAFVRDMQADGSGSVRARDLPDFKKWWQSLDPASRQACAIDFDKGYRAAVSDAVQRLLSSSPVGVTASSG